MRIKTGLKGIKADLAANKSGWHVFLGETYTGYVEATLKDVTTTETAIGYTLVGITGNALFFRKEDGSFGSRVWK